VILAIDSGTTRTRVWVLPDEGEPVEAASGLAGARDLARSHDRAWLLERVQEVTEAALAAVGAAWDEVEAVVGFGMITSELGLVEVPHLVAPVASRDLAAAMARWDVGALPAPLYLVPGVRTDAARIEGADVMRGEETEITGLLARGRVAPPFLYVSPGSHSKFVWVDEQGRILWSLTTLSGELMWALQRETILAGLVDVGSEKLDPVWVEEGARIAGRSGLTRALFVARLGNRLLGMSPLECSSLLHGAVAQIDLRGLEGALPPTMPPVPVALSQGGALFECYRYLLERRVWAREVHVIDEPLGAIGALALYEAGVRAGEKGRSLRA
jgi:2-dehydro-3-deoxygalactonokinase